MPTSVHPPHKRVTKGEVYDLNRFLCCASPAVTFLSSRTTPRPALAGLARFRTHARRKPRKIVFATSSTATTTVKRVRLRSITCVAPNWPWPMPKAPWPNSKRL